MQYTGIYRQVTLCKIIYEKLKKKQYSLRCITVEYYRVNLLLRCGLQARSVGRREALRRPQREEGVVHIVAAARLQLVDNAIATQRDISLCVPSAIAGLRVRSMLIHPAVAGKRVQRVNYCSHIRRIRLHGIIRRSTTHV